jgi:hypothetical protein
MLPFFRESEERIAEQAHDYYAALISEGGTVAEAYIVAEICERYGWTWEQYHEQPASFIRTILEKIKVEREVEKERAKKQNT